MEVVTITVTRKRTNQPVQYESAAAEIQVVANLDADDNWQEKAAELLVSTRALVYENLGLKLPAFASNKEVQTQTETAMVEVKTDDKKDDKPKRGPGRPRKENPDLPGTVPESDDDSESASDKTVDEAEVPTTMSQDELQSELIVLIKAKAKRDGTDIPTEAALARKTLFEASGVIKSSDVADEDVLKTYEAVKKVLG